MRSYNKLFAFLLPNAVPMSIHPAQSPIAADSAAMLDLARLRARIRTVPDWPAPGVMFRDITPLLQDGASFRSAIGHLAQVCADVPVDVVVGIEARGFIFGAALAHALNLGFVPMRKQGKLPFSTIAQPSVHEYGEAVLELHSDALKPAQRVMLVDDLVATGGTVLAAHDLIDRLGAKICVVAALIDLPDLGGSRRLREAGLVVRTLMAFDGH